MSYQQYPTLKKQYSPNHLNMSEHDENFNEYQLKSIPHCSFVQEYNFDPVELGLDNGEFI